MVAAEELSRVLRAGVLDGVSVLLARAGPSGVGERSGADAIASECSRLGASVHELLAIPLADAPEADAHAADPEDREQVLDREIERVIEQQEGGIDVLVLDAGAMHAQLAAAGARAALLECLQACWDVTRALANRAFLAPARPGRILYLAPASGAGDHAAAACAGLENLARTLSVEWARHHVTAVAIAPGAESGADEVATLVAYLASPAGAYFSGCLLDLRGAPVA
jgi:NAD(P)-dependent dehydrogenase (short-subunit alcohol dehydrogenase family)